MADQAAPPAGTGEPQGQPGNELHEQFISNAPEHLREYARELAPIWDQSVQRKFQESADYRKQWEPYEQLGINDIEPDELGELLAFREIVQDEDSFRQWYQDIGQLIGAEEVDDDDEDSDVPPEMRQFMNEFHQWREEQAAREEQQAQMQAFQETAMEVRQQLDEIKSKNPNLTEEDEEFICTLALKYDGEDAIQKGFADFQKLMSKAE